MRKTFKKLLVTFSAIACVLSSTITAFADEDVVLDGGGDPGASFIKEYAPGGGTNYTYMGYVYCFEKGPEYKYLQLSYKGKPSGLDQLRLEFIVNSDPSQENKLTPCWFNHEATDGDLDIVTVDGTEVPAPTDDVQTVVIDLEASGLDISQGFRAFHVHNTQGVGPVEFVDARLKTSPEITGVEEPTEDAEETTADASGDNDEATTKAPADDASEGEDGNNLVLILAIVAGGAFVGFAAYKLSKKHV